MTKIRNRQLALMALSSVLIAQPAVAASDRALVELLEVLHKDGTLSDEKYAAILKLVSSDATEKTTADLKRETKKQQVQQRQETVAAAQPQANITTKGKLELASPEGDFSMRVGGRLMMQGAIYDDDIAALGSGGEMRRARLFVQGKLWKLWNYKLQYDFTGSGKAGINDAYLQYTGLPVGNITLGHFKEPYSLQNMTSSKYTTFIERGLPNVFAAGRSVGMAYGLSGANWGAQAGLYGDGIDTPGGEIDQGYALSGRVTYAPVFEKGIRALHLGAGYSYRVLDDNKSLSFSDRPESHVTDVKLVNTGDFDADSLNRYGVEALWFNGPFSVQSEYYRVDVDRALAGNADVRLDGYYVESGWFLTGESLNYDPASGTLGKITPNKILGKGGFGAWQFAVRFSSLDLTDEDVKGGEEQNLSVGLNWYTNPNIRFMANYIKVLEVDGGPHAGDKPGALLLQAQVEF